MVLLHRHQVLCKVPLVPGSGAGAGAGGWEGRRREGYAYGKDFWLVLLPNLEASSEAQTGKLAEKKKKKKRETSQSQTPPHAHHASLTQGTVSWPGSAWQNHALVWAKRRRVWKLEMGMNKRVSRWRGKKTAHPAVHLEAVVSCSEGANRAQELTS